jgi:hypothetical protein
VTLATENLERFQGLLCNHLVQWNRMVEEGLRCQAVATEITLTTLLAHEDLLLIVRQISPDAPAQERVEHEASKGADALPSIRHVEALRPGMGRGCVSGMTPDSDTSGA